MMRRAGAMLVALAVLPGCGGGGGGGDGGGPLPGFTVAGVVTAIADSAADGDVRDPSAPLEPNDGFALRQPVPNPVTLGGHAGPSDLDDFYALTLAEDQPVSLRVGDPATGDLDLFLYDDGDQLVDSSEGTGEDEAVAATGAGTYTVRVRAFSGASTYVLHAGAAAATRAPRHAARYGADFVPGDVLVKFRENASARALGATAAQRVLALGLEPVAGGAGRALLARLPAPGLPAALKALAGAEDAADRKRQTLAAIKALSLRAEVEVAEPNLIRRALAVPNDPLYGQQWHYDLIHLPAAWDITTGSTDVIAAVIDTGVVLAHPDLGGQFDPNDPDGFDFISDPGTARDGDGRDGDADDPGDAARAGDSSFHGTHVAGTIAALTDNNAGVAGGSWLTRIMPLRVLGLGGGSSFDIQQAVLYAAGLPNASGLLPVRKADVLNLSLGGGGFSASEQAAYRDVVAAGVLVVAAAGNEGSSELSYPASYDDVVSVASVGRTKARAPYSQFNAAVDVAAPGGDQSRSGSDGVLSTLASDGGPTLRHTYAFYQGTSMATPHVAAVLALMRAVNPTLTQAQFEALLASGQITEDLGSPGRDNAFGHGLIDARRAVVAAADLAGEDPPEAPPVLVASHGTLRFGASLVQLAFELANGGGGELSVTGVSDDQPWLAVALETDRGGGLGRYAVTVDRSGLDDGLYTGTITVTSSANTVQIEVTLQVGAAAGADAGYTYVLLVDPETLDTVAQADGEVQDGTYPFAFDDVPAGSYLLVAGSDQDNDGFICDPGESCGTWPTHDLPEPLQVAGARTGLDFLTGFTLGSDAGAATAPAASPAPRGYRRLR